MKKMKKMFIVLLSLVISPTLFSSTGASEGEGIIPSEYIEDVASLKEHQPTCITA
ncbi:MAG: hypothetical protein OXB88_10170 [Bacteriovoracales bacterium]|nr:hypothetical protein [Bacteriovoracales bacterium]